MDLGLKGRRAIVSGGSQGVGYAIAGALAAEGANLALGARGQERLDQAAGELGKHGVDVHTITADFTREADCERFVEEAAKALGGIDILVNNVGGMVPGRIDTLTSEQWREVFDRNLMSYIWTTRYAIPHLEKSSMGRVLMVSGLSGKQLMPGALSTTLPNAAINGFTKQMAAELAPANVTVNNLCPGTVDTENWGPRAEMLAKVKGVTADDVRKEMAGYALLNRWGTPEEIGNAAAFLVSEKNSFMTGTTVEVCGGWAKYF